MSSPPAASYDDEFKKERVQELYTRLVSEDNADFLISPYSSGLTAAAAVIAEQNGKVMITAGAADDDTYKQGYTGEFQLYTPGSLYLTSTVDMLKTLDPNAKIAIVNESDKFTTSVVGGLKPYAEAQGFEIVLEEAYASDTADFGPIINKIADETLEFVGLAAKAEQLAGTLNVAQKKRLEMARALASHPVLLLLDEVLAGLNSSEVDGMIQTVLKIRDRGITIIMIEHLRKAVMNVSDHIFVLDYGQQIAEGSPGEIANNPKVIEAYLGDPKLAQQLLED